MPLDSVAEIETPELVRFRYRLAGPARGGLAYLIDLVIRAAVVAGLALILKLAFGREDAEGKSGSDGLILLVMFGSAVALYRLFRRSGWL